MNIQTKKTFYTVMASEDILPACMHVIHFKTLLLRCDLLTQLSNKSQLTADARISPKDDLQTS